METAQICPTVEGRTKEMNCATCRVTACPGETQDIMWLSRKAKVQSSVCLLECLRDIYSHGTSLDGSGRMRKKREEEAGDLLFVL